MFLFFFILLFYYGKTSNLTRSFDFTLSQPQNVDFKIVGYDSSGNEGDELLFSFVNDQNYFNDLYIEDYAFDRIYDILKPFDFKIIPIAQDLVTLSMTVGDKTYPFDRVNSSVGIYFKHLINFDPTDFDFEDQTIDTQILTITASDLKTQTIELSIPLTLSLGLDTNVYINDLQIEKNFYNVGETSERTWWKFDEGSGLVIYDASRNKDGSLIGIEDWTNGRVGDHALNLNSIAVIPSQPQSLGITSASASSKKMTAAIEQLLRGTTITASSVARAVLSEIGQEILIDPWIESSVSGLVRRAGGDAYWQMILSSLAESGREALSGPYSNIDHQQQQEERQQTFMEIMEDRYYQEGSLPTIQQVIEAFNQFRSEEMARYEQRKTSNG